MRIDAIKLPNENESRTETITVYRDDDKKVYTETLFWYKLKQLLQSQGFDVIRKEMAKDGHMVDDHEFYVRSRNLKKKKSFWIYDPYWNIDWTHAEYNKLGKVNLSIEYNVDKPE